MKQKPRIYRLKKKCDCPDCDGTGRERTFAEADERGPFVVEEWCQTCDGRGWILK